ncbi:hypothetical protein MPSEU_000923400 [Mayamaea pseudoterrestris]|nr:hypothetical protein MPSEU_000923400 [Mayamaea pseudoterrestris]
MELPMKTREAKADSALHHQQPAKQKSSGTNSSLAKCDSLVLWNPSFPDVLPTPLAIASSSVALVPTNVWGLDFFDAQDSKIPGSNKHRSTADTIVTYQSDQSVSSHFKPWTQAMILSSRLPLHPQPPTDCDDSIGCTRRKALLYREEDADEDDCTNSRAIVASTSYATDVSQSHVRTPIVILLMDPAQKSYELMQLWIDPQVDSVGDVMQAMQKQLHDKDDWKTDYEGLFHIRNSQCTQLTHNVRMDQYNAQPYQVYIAKPWSMNVKLAQQHASELVHFLQELQVLEAGPTEPPLWLSQQPHTPNAMTVRQDSVLLLSRQARARIFVSDGILTHYHACQFLSFCPPFELPVQSLLCLDVLGNTLAIGNDDSESVFSDDAEQQRKPKVASKVCHKAHQDEQASLAVCHMKGQAKPSPQDNDDGYLKIGHVAGRAVNLISSLTAEACQPTARPRLWKIQCGTAIATVTTTMMCPQRTFRMLPRPCR